MHILKTALSPLLLTSLLLLSGCQSLPTLFPENAKPQVASSMLHKHEFTLNDSQTLFGTLATLTTQENDTLPDIARHFGLGYNDITQANATIDPWTPQPGSQVLLPLQFTLPDAPHEDIILNLATMRLFYFPKTTPNTVLTYPVGIGREGWNTPTGRVKITSKTANPSWTVPTSIKREHAQKGDPLPAVIKSGPDNPLGYYAMRLTLPSYLIHGTNKPYGIGMQVSHGCVQLYPEDIEVLFNRTPVGTTVNIVHQPYLTAWHHDRLYLEASPPLQNHKRLKAKLFKKLRQISTQRHVAINWEKVKQLVDKPTGVPTPIAENSPTQTALTNQAMPIQHPQYLKHQPAVADISPTDWAILVARFNDKTKAQQLVALLNHQGPIIPARKIEKDNAYEVIAGPFKNQSEAIAAEKRLHMDFELDTETLKPGQLLIGSTTVEPEWFFF